MTNVAKALQAYGVARRAQPPLKVLVEVYDAVLTQVARAKVARVENRREDEFKCLSKATNILTEMDANLNRRDPDALAMTETLSRYYQTVIVQAHTAFRTKGDAGLDRYSSVHRQVLVMRDAWANLAGEPPLTAQEPHQEAVAG
ncbi:flagellar export chaperone FliS [Pararhodospirillum photometricum]|uniref:Flagellar protein FliS n=1 Tax=Pararhodospirillum photometricum DSM 122 TaxID=1150469 RepID=H6SN78_PARPM|nr:flagellar protein FliS [Pararhodospirillum photometricum]CCG06954.1 Putative uncharacterized protein [Pararhodospirillum photometricum DSM 122]